MIAESPTSPRARDRIAVDPINTDTIARLHAEAEATGRSIAAIAADWHFRCVPLTFDGRTGRAKGFHQTETSNCYPRVHHGVTCASTRWLWDGGCDRVKQFDVVPPRSHAALHAPPPSRIAATCAARAATCSS